MAAGGVSPLACWRGSTGCTAGRSTRLSAFRPDPVPMASNSSLDQWRLHYFLGTSQDQTHRKGLHSVRFPEPYNPDTDPWHEDDEALPEPGYPGKLPGGPQMQTAARSSKPTGQWDPSWADPPPWAITQEVAADFIAQSATHQAQPYMQHNQPTPSKPEPASQHAATTHRDHTDDNTETGAGQPQQLSSDPHQAVQAAAPPTQEAAPAMDNNTGGAEQAPNNQASDQPTFDQGQHTNPSKVEPQTQQPPQEPVQETEQPESGNTAGWRQPRTNSITSAAIGRGAHPLKAKEDRGGGCFTDLRFPPTQRPQQQHPASSSSTPQLERGTKAYNEARERFASLLNKHLLPRDTPTGGGPAPTQQSSDVAADPSPETCQTTEATAAHNAQGASSTDGHWQPSSTAAQAEPHTTAGAEEDTNCDGATYTAEERAIQAESKPRRHFLITDGTHLARWGRHPTRCASFLPLPRRSPGSTCEGTVHSSVECSVDELGAEVLRMFDSLPSDDLKRGQSNVRASSKSYATGAYVLGGAVGLKAHATEHPEVLKVCARFVHA